MRHGRHCNAAPRSHGRSARSVRTRTPGGGLEGSLDPARRSAC
ncbi:hypothetical protein L810_7032 [Burkholderia sp. AU4i]|nr:hypothetical protein L810_7032 [Burkholderia sp. AU4i]